MSIALNGPLALIGAGKMGGAMIAGWLDRGLDPKLVYVQDPGPPPEVAALLQKHGIQVHAELPAANMPEPAVLLVAVKPQVMDQVFPPVAKRAGQRHRGAVDRGRQDDRRFRTASAGRHGDHPRHAEYAGRGRSRRHRLLSQSAGDASAARARDGAAVRRRPGRLGRGRGA